jgi:hypothetical protein
VASAGWKYDNSEFQVIVLNAEFFSQLSKPKVLFGATSANLQHLGSREPAVLLDGAIDDDNGRISGIPFRRLAWKKQTLDGVLMLPSSALGGSLRSTKAHKALYVAIDGENYIVLFCASDEPFESGTFRTLETAARTFQRAEQ